MPAPINCRRLVILTEGRTEPVAAKTAACVIRYGKDEVVALLDSTQAGKTAQELLGVGGAIPVVARLEDAPTADTLLIGIAPTGGRIPPAWRSIVMTAIERGYDVLSGMHEFFSDDPEFAEEARHRGVQLIDIRKNTERDVANRENIRPDCLRILTVGQDCSVGKMVVSVEVARALHAPRPRCQICRHRPDRDSDRRAMAAPSIVWFPIFLTARSRSWSSPTSITTS